MQTESLPMTKRGGTSVIIKCYTEYNQATQNFCCCVTAM